MSQQYPTQPGQPTAPWGPPPPPKKSSTGKVIGIVVASIVGFIVLALLLLGGCAAMLSDAGNNVDSSAPGAGPTGDKPKTDDSSDDGTVGLTDKVTYENGVQVQLSGFDRGKTGEFAVPQNTDYVKFTVKMVNGSKETVDATALYVQCQYGENPAHDGEMVFDHDHGIEGSPSTHVTPGNSITYVMACVMPKDESRMQVEASPSWVSDTALFVGKLK